MAALAFDMGIRSDILIHWTGKHLSNESDESKVIAGYIELLTSIYAKGLRYSYETKDEVVIGAKGASTTVPKTPMICFTELRLSDVQQHTTRYGKMGIGFRREWLMRYGANPVFYVQNRNEGVVNTNLGIIVDNAKKVPGLEVFLSFVKPMSEPSQDNLINYDEMEWRMVLCSLSGHNYSDWIHFEGDTPYFKFSPNDVSIIVAPDEQTRRAILDSTEMKTYFNLHLPMMVDADKCSQF